MVGDPLRTSETGQKSSLSNPGKSVLGGSNYKGESLKGR